MPRLPQAAVAAVAFLAVAPFAGAEPYGGVEFPFGEKSFADSVVSYTPGTNVSGESADATNVLGVPDGGSLGDFVSLGVGGSLVVEFTDNLLVDQDAVENGNDIYIFEIGPAVEGFFVEISVDGVNYIDLGLVSGQPTGIDIKPFITATPDAAFRFVRLTDDGVGNSTAPSGGADIDAIGAIGATAIPEPATMAGLLGGAGLLALRRRR